MNRNLLGWFLVFFLLSSTKLLAEPKTEVKITDTARSDLGALPAPPDIDCEFVLGGPPGLAGAYWTEISAPITVRPKAPTDPRWIMHMTVQTDPRLPAIDVSSTYLAQYRYTFDFFPMGIGLGVGPIILTATVSGPAGSKACTLSLNLVAAPPPSFTLTPAGTPFVCGAGTATIYVTAYGYPYGGRITALSNNCAPPYGPGPFPLVGAFNCLQTYNYQVYYVTAYGTGGLVRTLPVTVPGYCQYPAIPAGQPDVFYLNPGTAIWTMDSPVGDLPQCNYQASHWTPNASGPIVRFGQRFSQVTAAAPRGCNPGCFAPEARILMGNKTEKRADEIRVGDVLWNPARQRGVKVRKVIAGPEAMPLVDVGIDENSLRVSSKHPFVTPEGLKQAEKLTRQDQIQGRDGKFHKIKELWRPGLSPNQIVYNFELDTSSSSTDDHLVVANGIITGDFFLQTKYETSP